MAPCSCRRILSWLSSLRLRVFRSSWISPLCFPFCRYAYMATCAALPHVSGWSFALGNISFWLGFGRCLIFLFAPCGCRRTYCGPHCGSESARVLVSLIDSSPSGGPHLSRVCSSVWGHVGVAHPFHPSLLLGGVLVRFCGGPTVALWLCPVSALCLLFASVLFVDPVRIVAPLAQCLCWRYPSFTRGSSCGGASPHV